MILLQRLIMVTLLVCAHSLPSFAEPVKSIFLKTVSIRSNGTLDSQARSELAAVAARIKKNRPRGTVIVTGHAGMVLTAEDYPEKSVIFAKTTADHLRTLLEEKYQIYVSAAYPKDKTSSKINSVSIYLYPFELKALDFRFISSMENIVSIPVSSSEPVKTDRMDRSGTLSDSTLTSPEPETGPSTLSEKSTRHAAEPSEDPAQAEELVNRAKARAAERARRIEQGN